MEKLLICGLLLSFSRNSHVWGSGESDKICWNNNTILLVHGHDMPIFGNSERYLIDGKLGLLHDYFWEFFHVRWKILFSYGRGGGGGGVREVRLNPKVRLKWTLGKLGNSKNSNFLFGWRGVFIKHFFNSMETWSRGVFNYLKNF